MNARDLILREQLLALLADLQTRRVRLTTVLESARAIVAEARMQIEETDQQLMTTYQAISAMESDA